MQYNCMFGVKVVMLYEGPSVMFVTWLTISANHYTDLIKWCRFIDTQFIHNVLKYINLSSKLKKYGCTAHHL